MEKLAKWVAVTTLVSVAVTAGALYLLHLAFNEGNFWMGLVAVGLLVVFGRMALIGLAGFIGGR